MAYSRTLSELELAVRREADMVNSQFVTSAEVRAYINQSWAELYDRIVLFDQEYLLRYVEITSTGAGEYDILNAGKNGQVISLSWIVPSGTGYAVGDVIQLTQPSTGANTCWATVTTVTGIGAVSAATVIVVGKGYVSDSTSSFFATLNMSPISGVGVGGVAVGYIESDFYKCKGVWYGSGTAGNTSTFNPLRRFMWDEQNLLRQAGIYEGSNELPYYRIYTVNGRELLSIAPDTLGGIYRVYYYPAPQRMLIDNDRVDGRAGWDEWVVKDSAIKCLLKEESVEQAAAIKVIRDELFQRFQLHASERDAAQPERIRRTALLSNRYGWWR
jgi:hypothetical protein